MLQSKLLLVANKINIFQNNLKNDVQIRVFFKFQSFLAKEKMDKKNVQFLFSETKVGIKNMQHLDLEHIGLKLLNLYFHLLPTVNFLNLKF